MGKQNTDKSRVVNVAMYLAKQLSYRCNTFSSQLSQRSIRIL
ncbi:General vesicular transport factor p115 [Apodemus speciosus]|uniref:General vesicular transport factor p115 n=1 Tax=Apodemus speciosus TaxID=105296 RepID=A0ABQ0ESR9_APOSI